jgi:tetratricopeptide (TPR) repeat protein
MRALILAQVVCLAVIAPVAHAQPTGLKPRARDHYERGLRLYERNRFDEAIAELRAGLAIDPQPEILYALAQAERKSGHCERALEHYQSCMALLKNPAAAAAVRVQIERCRVEQERAAPAAPEPANEPANPNEAAAPEGSADGAAGGLEPSQGSRSMERALLPETTREAPAPSRSWARDPLAISLTAIGVAGLAAGATMVGVARVEASQAGDSYQQFADARNAPSLWTGGVVTLSVGGALIAGAVIRWAVLAARHRGDKP